jgi:pimeloyl-ACP methyl ester carboxylesterase
LKAPELVQSLVLADPGFRIEQSCEAHGFLAEIARQLEAGEADAALASFIDTVNGAGTWRHMVSWFKNMVRDNVYTLISQARETDLVFEPARAGQLECPVLLLGGESSPPRYGRVIDALIPHIPQAQRDTIALAAHGMNLANPKAFNERVLRFTAQCAERLC